jgi:hypothetical protein
MRRKFCKNGCRLVWAVTEKLAGFWRVHWALKWALALLLLVLVALGVAISIALKKAEPILRAAIVRELEEHFHARVELDGLHVSLVNGLWAEGNGLRIWPPAEVGGVTVPGANAAAPQIQPLIEIDKFGFHAPLRLGPGEPVRISIVELEGLKIDVPPKPHFTQSAPAAHMEEHGIPLLRFEVDSIECHDAHLTIETSKPGKLPLEFAIAHVKLTIANAGTMQFDAELTNPKPAGTVLTTGTMGPWRVDDPGQTPLRGSYRFEHADLGVFKDIAGILTSTGNYQGILRDLMVDGETDTPDFRLTKYGTAVPLHTEFHAHVDGTNGDTWLQPVDATLGRSHFICKGKVVHVQPGIAASGSATPGGHEIDLDVLVNGGRMEDFLRLTSKSGTPLLTGTLELKTTLEIPPGTRPVDERLRLKGSFTLVDAEFTSAKIQSKVDELSLRGQGRPKEARHDEGGDVRSVIASDFTMADAMVTLPDLKYTVPGAEIDLSGTYGVGGGALNFTGTAKTDATVSQLVGGWKGVLLKPADRLFKKDGAGTEVSIQVNGTPRDPKFTVELDRTKQAQPQAPRQPY